MFFTGFLRSAFQAAMAKLLYYFAILVVVLSLANCKYVLLLVWDLIRDVTYSL